MIGWQTPDAVAGIRQVAMQSQVRTGALYAFVFRNPHSEQTFKLIAKATHDPDPKARWAAVNLLLMAAPSETNIEPFVAAALQDSDSKVRDVAKAVQNKISHP
jgi:HEAT repeat protein